MGKTEQLETFSAKETRKFFQSFAKSLKSGTIVGFRGPLGAGKTTAIQAILDFFGISGGESPTFVMIRPYPVKNRLFDRVVHIDAYRLEKEDDILTTGLTDVLNDRAALILIEWADNIAKFLPLATVWVDLEHLGGDTRKITITWG